MSKKLKNVLLSSITLLIGSFIYVIIRHTTYVGKLFDNFYIVDSLRNMLTDCSSPFVMYYLPDFLWSFSLCCGLLAIFTPQKRGILLCGLICFIYGCIWEVLQLLHVLGGTFDFYDITMYLIAATLAVILNLKGL